jgi:hypothetical protein
LPYLSSLRLLLIIAFITLSTGCGGGGGSSSKEPIKQNQPPTVAVGEDLTVNELQNVEIQATAEDKDGTITSYFWTQVSGEEVDIINADSLKMSFQSPKVLITDSTKTLVFRLSITDNSGASAQGEITITVEPVNELPVANAGDDKSYLIDEIAQLECNDSHDPDGYPVTFEWSQTKGPQVSLTNPSSCNPSFHLPVEPAEFEFSLTVTDEDETSGLDSVGIHSRNYAGINNNITKESLILRSTFSDVDADFFIVDEAKGVAFSTDYHTITALDISDPMNIKELGWSFSNNFSYLGIVEDLLFVNGHYEFWIFDISDINNITALSATESGSQNLNFKIKDDILYLTAGSAGIKTFDISDPRNLTPIEIEALKGDGSSSETWYKDIEIVGNLMYATSRLYGLKVFDISDPLNTRLVGRMECICHMGRIEREEELLVIWTGNNLSYVDISAPLIPKIVADIPPEYNGFSTIKSGLLASSSKDKISFLDVSNPSTPKFLGDIDYDYGGNGDVYIVDNVLLQANDHKGINSFDISTLALPVADKYELGSDYKINAFVVDDDQLFISSMNEGLSIFDISSIEETSLIGELSIQTANSMRVEDNTLFLTSDNGLNIINIEDAANPSLLSRFASNDRMFSIDVNDKLAVVSDGFSLKSLNIENLENPTLIDEVYFTPVAASGITLHNNTALVTNAYSDLSALDTTKPFEQQQLHEFDGGSSESLAIYENYAYSGGVVFEITDTNDLVKLKEIEGFGSKVKIFENMLYTVDQDIGVSKYSLSNPIEPKLVSSYQLSGRVGDIAFNNNQVYNLEYSNNGWDLQDYYSVFDYDKSLKVSSNYTHLNSNERYSYSAVWQLDTKVKLGCYVSGGECEIVLDSNNSAEVFWITPETAGDYIITIVIGNTSFFDSYEDRVIVE